MYSREFPTGGNFLFFVVCMMSLFRLPRGKLAFAQRSGAMKAPVGLLSDRTVLRKQDGGASPRQVTAGLPHCSSRQGWPGRMPVPDVRWLHRDKGKCLWTFSFCSNARSFDRPTVAKPGKKIKVPFFIRRKGADAFRPALAAGGSLMAYKCLSLCDFFIVQHFFKLCHICLVLFENLRGLHFHIGIIRHLGEILHQEINILLDSPDGSF